MSPKSIDTVLVIILNYRGFDDTERAVGSLLEQTYKNTSILIVENGSNDGSIEKIATLQKKISSPTVSMLVNPKNLGFAGGVNTGILYALKNNFNYVALLNNDATADPSWVEQLVKSAKKNKSDITTGILLSSDGNKIDSAGEEYSRWGVTFSRFRDNNVSLIPESGYIFGATGGATLYSTELFRKIGLFDESFFAYYEDADINFRAQLAGYKIYYTKNAVAYHKKGVTSSKMPGFTVYQTFKNIPLLYIKNVPGNLLFPIGSRLFILYWLIFANAIKNGSGFAALKGWLASIWYFWTKALWSRFIIQSRKNVSGDYIKSIIYPDLPPEQTGMRKFRKFFTGK